KWGKRAAFKEGRVSFAYSRFLGYEKVEDEIVIVEEEAKTVERIYKMFLVEGETPTGIAKVLREEKVKTPSGRSTNWQTNNIISILTNEKYKGDALLQKTYVDNFLTQNVVKNTGQKPQYYVENSHPAIIDRDMWELVQVELERREKMGAKYSASDIFASKLICEDCGGFYGRKKWHSNTKYERYVYQCNKKFRKGNKKCKTPHLSELEIKEKFIRAYNLTMDDKELIKDDLESVIKLLTDTGDIDKKINETNEELIVLVNLAKQAIDENSKTNLKDDEFNQRYNSLLKRHEGLQKDLDRLLEIKQEKQSKAIRMNAFLNTMYKTEDELSEWNKLIWMLMVENGVVNRDKSVTFKFNGHI
ncbi:MAG TPA: recombinase family protein, partial [Acholeplasmataceae bacterium]|nr:recombinase family protein [Acholeplasmataceae bacterium]